MDTNIVKVFAPATVANVSCGFDVLGFAMGNTGDTLIAEKNNSGKITISSIQGPGNLSTDPDKNICGVITKEMLANLGQTCGIDFKLTKGVLPGSGMGSSAASSAATAVAINHLFGSPFSLIELVQFAMIGEKLASGTPHADNVAPALFGGFVAVRSYNPLDIIKIPVPEQLYATVIHPKIEVRTELSRNILKKEVELKTAIKQWGNVAGLVAGLYSSNYELIGRSLQDYIVEPIRALLIPGFYNIVDAAKNAGALGCGISGSGPSIFSLNKGLQTAQKVGEAMSFAAQKYNLPCDVHVSKISPTGCTIS